LRRYNVVKTGYMDMVDAWLMIQVCSKRQPDTNKFGLNCYHATTQAPAGRPISFKDENKQVDLGLYEGNTYP
jgi:hypothetical protein